MWNVALTFCTRVLAGISEGAWAQVALPNYIYLTQYHSNKLVGLAQGIQGTFNALAALPAGRLADKTRRDTILRIFGAIGMVALAALVAAILCPNQTLSLFGWTFDSNYVILCCGLALWGCTQGGACVSDALFADSIPTGARSKYFTALFASILTAASVGPLLGALLFTLHGNTWDVHTLRLIVLWGLGLSLLPVAGMFFFDDEKALGAESEAHLHQPLLEADGAADAEAGGAMANVKGAEEQDPKALPCRPVRHFGCLTTAWIPYLLASSDFVAGIASGMTIKFFPIFFLEAVQLPPIQVSIIMAAAPLAIAATSAAIQPLSRGLGRAQVCLLTRLVAVGLLFYMGLVPSIWQRLAIIVPVFIVRSALSNCSYGLRKSILMDFVPKSRRATWNSLESVMVFGWSGSAFVGGLLVDSYGFDLTFVITAAMQAISCLMFVPLLMLVPGNESSLGACTGAEPSAAGDCTAQSSLGTDAEVRDSLLRLSGDNGEALDAAMATPALTAAEHGVEADASLLGTSLGRRSG